MALKMPTVMPSQHSFSMVPRAEIQRSVFDRSHGYKTTFNAGYLIPFYADEVLPGDTFSLSAHILCRLSTPIKPVMDNMFVETFFFFVPLRLIWANFQKFMGEQEPNTYTVYTVPQLNPPVGGYAVGSLCDYLGIPTGIACTGGTRWTTSAFWTRAYYLIYNQWFRDQNLIGQVSGVGQAAATGVGTGDGPDTGQAVGGCPVLKRGKRHDYFTSALPFTQKAAAAVSMPLGSTAPLITDGTQTMFAKTTDLAHRANLEATSAGNPKFTVGGSVTAGGAFANTDPLTLQNAGMVVDLTNASGATINALRQAFQIQKFLEKDARGGTRYTEKVRAHFGVVSPDARLQRAEYLGGGSTPMNVVPVAQSAPKGAQVAPNDTTIGNLSGFGQAFATQHGFTKSFTEHGVLLGIVNVRADLTYSQGIERMFSRSTIYDFYWPSFAHLGEQSILNKEIYLADDATQNAATFGYQERYAEYRYKPSRVTGLMAPNAAGTIAVWNLSEKFTALPTLAQTFMEDQTSAILDRVLAVSSEPDVIMDSYIQLRCARPMPVYSVPGLVDHF